MVWRGTSLRYETGEKKLNEVDFNFQGMELVSRILVTMAKTLDCMMVVKEIENGLLEEVEFGWWFEQDIDDQREEVEEDEDDEDGGEV
ncbi:hypothetical protein Tco_0593687 [Tanacetum coccineum]